MTSKLGNFESLRVMGFNLWYSINEFILFFKNVVKNLDCRPTALFKLHKIFRIFTFLLYCTVYVLTLNFRNVDKIF